MPIHGGSSGKDSFEDQSYSNHGSISLQYDKFKNGSSTLVYNNPNPMSYHSYARSITSSIDGGSIKDGTSPDKVGVLRKSIQPGLGTFTSLNELALYNVEAELPRNKFISRRSTTMDKRRGGGISGVESKKQILATPNTPFIRSKARNPPIITLEMLNSDDLDLYDDVYTQSLLASQNEDKIRLYRDQYADILYLWGLPVSRIKILKFNYPEGVSDYKSPFDVHKGSFGVRNKIKKKNLDNPNIRFVSPITTSLIQPQAWNTAKVSALKYCNLCGLLVTKRLVLCNNCEHVLHADCAVEWWPSEDEEENDSIECPSGCGCTCLKYRI